MTLTLYGINAVPPSWGALVSPGHCYPFIYSIHLFPPGSNFAQIFRYRNFRYAAQSLLRLHVFSSVGFLRSFFVSYGSI